MVGGTLVAIFSTRMALKRVCFPTPEGLDDLMDALGRHAVMSLRRDGGDPWECSTQDSHPKLSDARPDVEPCEMVAC
jgi:hypothetical protein